MLDNIHHIFLHAQYVICDGHSAKGYKEDDPGSASHCYNLIQLFREGEVFT